MDLDTFERSKFKATDLLAKGEYDQALKLFRELETFAPDSEERGAVLIGEYQCYEALDMFDEARKCLQVAATLGEQTPEYASRIEYLEARLDGDEGKNRIALGKLNRLLEAKGELLRSPDCRDLYESVQMRRLEYLTNLGEMKEALPLFTEARGFEVEKPRSFKFRMAYCLAKCGYVEQAHALVKEGLAETSNITEEVRGRYYLGSIYVAEKKYAEALTQFQFCETHLKDSDISHEHLMDALSYVYEKLGKPKDAARYRQVAKDQYKH